jgi:uncharacterized protein (TIRG00374 family)
VRRSIWLRALQIGVTLALIVVLIKQIRWADLTALAARAQWGLAALSAAPVVTGHILNVKRWQGLIRDATLRYDRLVVYYGAGLFANNFLPTGLGGDGVRAALLGRDVSIGRAAFSVGLDRSIGLASYTALLAIGWIIKPLPGLTLDRVAVGAAQVTAILLGLTLLALGVGVLAVRTSPRVRRRVSDARQGWALYRGSLAVRRWLIVLSVAYGLSALSNLLLAVAHWLILSAFGLNLGFDAAVWLVLIGSLSLLLPIAINGLGVMESVYVLVLARYGVAAIDALAVALSIRALMIGFSLLGGVLSLIWKPHSLKDRVA